LIIGDGLLKFCIAFIDLRVKRGGVKFFPGYGELVDESEVKTAESFDGSVASGFRECGSAATRNEDCGSTQQNISRHKRRFHMAVF